MTALCGSEHGDLSFASGTALVAYLNCTASSTGGTYSSVTGSTTFSSGSHLIFDLVSNTSVPLYMSSFTAASDVQLEVISSTSTDYSVTLAKYASPGSCTASFGNTSIDGCTNGATCTVSGGIDSSNSSLCSIVFTQSQESSDGDSQTVYLGLLGLLAFVPIVGVAVWLAYSRAARAGDPEYPVLEYSVESAQEVAVDMPSPYLYPTPITSAVTPYTSPVPQPTPMPMYV